MGSTIERAEAVRREIEMLVSQRSPSHVFVHCGVVAVNGCGLLLPGRSLSGKSSLVAALISRGATYCSDEFAPLDEQGLVHPYPRPLGIRANRRELPQPLPAASFTELVGAEPVPVTAVVLAIYEPGAVWKPEVLTPGEGLLRLLDNTVMAREEPERCLTALERVVDGARVLEGMRGEADETAVALLADERLWGWLSP